MVEEHLPGDHKRKQALAARLKAIRESYGLRQADMERIASELTHARIRQWELPDLIRAKPRLASLVILSRAFGYPYEYFWPPLAEDRYELDPGAIRDELMALSEKLRDRGLSKEETERYTQLLELEQRLASQRHLGQFARPYLHLVCVLDEFYERPEHLPKPLDAWAGAWVMPVPGAEPTDQVYAYCLPTDSGLPAGTWVLFRPRFDGRVERGRWVFGNRRGTPYVGRTAPDDPDFVVIGEVLLALYQPR